MPHPLHSAYNGILTDDGMSLAQGVKVVTTTLVNDLDIGDDECLLADASGAQGRGTMIVDDEIIYYSSRLGNVPSTVEGLQREQDGTAEADHTAGTPVMLVGAPRFGNPALLDAILMMQDHLVELKAVKKYVALLSQILSNDPSVTELENTLGGTVVWTRVDVGTYTGVLNNAFVDGQTACFAGSRSASFAGAPSAAYLISVERIDDDTIGVQTMYQDALGRDGGVLDGLLANTPIEILVYP